MTLKDRVNEDMKSALRAKETARLSALRMLLAAIKQREIDERKTLTDAELLSIVERMLKQRRESIEQYQRAGRADLVSAEEFEVSVLGQYLPAALPDAEVETLVMRAIEESGARAMSDMGKVMGRLKERLTGRADMAKVSALVKAKLGN